MATDTKIVEMLEALKKLLSIKDNYIIAEVCSVNPLKIKINDLVIEQHIYADPIYIQSSLPDMKFSVGDNVIVFQDDVSFYIIERVKKIV